MGLVVSSIVVWCLVLGGMAGDYRHGSDIRGNGAFSSMAYLVWCLGGMVSFWGGIGAQVASSMESGIGVLLVMQ